MSPSAKKPKASETKPAAKKTAAKDPAKKGARKGESDWSQMSLEELVAATGKPVSFPAKLRKRGGGSEALPRIMRRIGLWVAAAAASVVGCFLVGCQRNDGGDILPVTIGGVSFNMRWCPPGTFKMGSPSSEKGRDDDETQHRVTLTKGFWIGETEVTQELWQKVMGGNPSYNSNGGRYPVENVSWNGCKKFIDTLNARSDVKAQGLRFALPTEAQWEYACRAGTTGAYGGTGRLDDMGWYADNSGNTTHPVKEKQPNAWGLYDMHGNVWEWCADWDRDYPYPASGADRVLRGGSSWYNPQLCRSASRNGSYPDYRNMDYGFRLVALQDGR